MKLLKLLPVVFSFMLLSAHFYRASMIPIAAICLALPFLLFMKKMWVARLIQIYLIIGALEWFRTLYIIATMRMEHGEPWIRLSIIISVVGLFTGFSALIFQTKELKKHYYL